MRTMRLSAVLIWSLGFLMIRACGAADILGADDKQMLESLIGHPLPDPSGAVCVRLKVPVRTVWAASGDVEREGWLKAGANGQPARVYFSGGESLAALPDDQMVKIDFVAECQKRYGPATREQEQAEEQAGDAFERMQQTAIGGIATNENDLTLAAWLHRLGMDDLAAKALEKARTSTKRNGKDPLAVLLAEFAWRDFAGMVHAYMVRADQEALDYAERFVALKVDDKEYAQAKLIFEELKRRQKNGTFSKTPSTMPANDYDHWTVAKKVAYWIEALDEVDARQMGQPGGIDLSSDPRIAALIDIGEPAVPALINTIEKDERLTRAVHFWRDFSHDRTVIGVREAALTAVMSILRVHVFEPVSTGDTFTGRGDDETKQTVARLRAYWARYGKLPFDERMMNILTDPLSGFEAVREAADDLASLGERRTIGTTVWSGHSEGAANGPNPVIEKFRNPTTAEAMLAAMDRDLAHHDATEKGKQLYEYERHGIEDGYMSSLAQLGDKRIAAELSRRSAAAESVTMRRKFAYVAQILGDPKPFDLFAGDFETGKIKLPGEVRANTNDGDQPANVELKGIVGMLIGARTPQANAALLALAQPKHPQHDAVLTHIRKDSPEWSDNTVWFRHPYWILMLRADLDDTHPTGGHYSIEKDMVELRHADSSSSSGIPASLADALKRLDHADERVCDMAAQKYAKLILGAPECHPLLKDDDERLARLRTFLDRFQGNFRLLDGKESRALNASPFDPVMIPAIKPLGRPATEEDVKQGRAIFSLPRGAKVADVKLPAVAYRKNDPKHEKSAVLILQAEIGSDGKIVYGMIGVSGMETLSAGEVGQAQAVAE